MPFGRLSVDLVVLSRYDGRTFVERAESFGLKLHRHQRPKYTTISKREIEKRVQEVCRYVLKLYATLEADDATSKSNDATTHHLTPSPITPTPTLACFFQFYHKLFRQCNDMLDYAQFLDTLVAASCPSPNGRVVDAFLDSQLAYLLQSTLHWLTRGLQKQLETQNATCCSIEIGNLIQSALSLLCRCGHAELNERTGIAPGGTADRSNSVMNAFRGLSLQRMLALLRESHQFTTTVYRTSASSASGLFGSSSSLGVSGGGGGLQTILVPFAQKVLTGLFNEFTSQGQRDNKRTNGTVTMSKNEFVNFFLLCTSDPIGGRDSLGSSLASSQRESLDTTPRIVGEVMTSAIAHAPPYTLPVAINIHVNQPPGNTTPPVLTLPTAPTITRAHTAMSPALSSHTLLPLQEPLSLQYLPSSVAQLQASAEFRKAVNASSHQRDGDGATPHSMATPTIDLKGWLKWHLDGFTENARGKLDSLTHLDRNYDWSRSQSRLEREYEPTTVGKWSAITREMKDMYALLLEQVFPSPDEDGRTETRAEMPKRSADDLDIRSTNAQTIPDLKDGINRPNSSTNRSVSTLSLDCIPRLMESEANWMHHPAHQTFSHFLDTFTECGRPGQSAPRPPAPPSKKDSFKSTSIPKLDAPLVSPTIIAAAPVNNTEVMMAALKDDQKTQNPDSIEKQRSANGGDEKTPYDTLKITQPLMTVVSPPDSEYGSLLLSAHTGTPISVAPSPSVPVGELTGAPLSEFPGGELEEPARCFSSLFTRCISEMGGGAAKKRIEAWQDATRAEKAYAAACIKHNGITAEVVQYSSSVKAVELLRLARLSVNPRTGLPSLRVLSHPSCPQWLKSIVTSTFQEVRSPLLTLLRAIEDEEETIEALKGAAQPNNAPPTVTDSSSSASPPSDSPPSDPAAALRRSYCLLKKLQRQSRSLVQRVLTNSMFLVKDLDDIQKEIHSKIRQAQEEHEDDSDLQQPRVQSDPSIDEDEREDDRNGSDGGEEDDVPAALPPRFVPARELVSESTSSGPMSVPSRYRTVTSRGARSTHENEPLTLPAHLIVSDVFTDARDRRRIESGPHSSVGLRKSLRTAASDASISDAPPPIPTIERQLSDIVRRRRHSVLTISPAEQPAAADVLASPIDGTEVEDIIEVSQATSIANYLSSRTTQDDPAEGHKNSPSSLWSSWSSSASHSGQVSYDSKWLHKLIQSGGTATDPSQTNGAGTAQPSPATLKELLQPSIHRFQTVCLLRLKLLSWINFCFTIGHSKPIVDIVFPLLHACMNKYARSHQAHLLHYGQLVLRGENTKNVLLHFYKHLVSTINEQLPESLPNSNIAPPVGSIHMGVDAADADSRPTAANQPVSYDDPGWSRIRSCLRLLRLDFLSEDTESLVGSGVFAALFRTIHQIDEDIQAQTPTHMGQPVPSAERLASPTRGAGSLESTNNVESSSLPTTLRFAAAYHLKFICWQTLKSLITFVLSQQPQSYQSNSVLLSSVARQFVLMMINQLELLSRAPARLPLQHEDGSLMYSLDAARMLWHFTRIKSVCHPHQIIQLVQLSVNAPTSIQTVIVQLLTYELHRITPNELDQAHTLSADIDMPPALFTNTDAPVSTQIIENLLDRVGERLVANTVLPSLIHTIAQTHPPSRGRASRSSTVSTAQAAPGHPNASFFSPLLTRSELIRPTRLNSTSVSVSGVDETRPPFWHESGYQTWRSYPHFLANNEIDASLIEEIIIAIRSLANDRNWRPTIMRVINTHILKMKHIVQDIVQLSKTHAYLSASNVNGAIPSCQSLLGSLGVLGAHPFQLRSGATVDVLIHSRRSMRGTVIAIDTHLCQVLVRLSPSQPNMVNKPYARPQTKGTSEEFIPATPIEQEFSFDQLRVVESLPPPLLAEFSQSSNIWTLVREVMTICADLSGGAASAPTLHRVFGMQLEKHIVQLLQVQLASSISRARGKAEAAEAARAPNDATTHVTFSIDGSPMLSPMVDPVQSPTSPPGFHLEPQQYPLAALSPIPPSPADPVASPTHSPAPSPTAIKLQSKRPSNLTSWTPPAPGRTIGGSRRPMLDMAIKISPPEMSEHDQHHQTEAAPIDFFTVIPLLLAITDRFEHQLTSLSVYELEQSSALFSRRLCESIRAEEKHKQMWDAGESDSCHRNESDQTIQRRSSIMSESDRVTFIPFVGSDSHESGSSASYRRCLIQALQTFFDSHRQLSTQRTRGQLLPRLLIFPLLTMPTAGSPDRPAVGASKETGIIVVQLPTTIPVRKDAPEFKETAQSAADPTVPRLLNLADVGLSEALANSILPVTDYTGDIDEVEAEAIEMVLGDGCEPESWNADRWSSQLSRSESSVSFGGDATLLPSAGEMSITARRVIIGPSGQAAVLTSATPAASRPTSPTPNHAQRTMTLQVTNTTRPATTAATSNTPPVLTEQTRPLHASHLRAKYVRTTTHQERTSLLTHIAAIASGQSLNPRDWKMYDWVDARDSYGDWYLGQILGWRGGTPHNPNQEVFVHFFAWDDMYREWITVPQSVETNIKPTDRLRRPSLFNETRDRLEADRFIRKVKIYGSAVLAAMKIERDLAMMSLARDHARQVASISMSDPYSYPPASLTFPSVGVVVAAKLDSSALTVGTQVLVTAAAVELLSLQLGRGLLDLATDYMVGDRIMLLDTVNKLCEGEVIECRFGSGPTNFHALTNATNNSNSHVGEIKIHYVGWPDKWNEWISVVSPRIQSKRVGLAMALRSHRSRLSRSDTWNGAGGHASQLIGLVGQKAVITKLARASSNRIEMQMAEATSKYPDTLAQIQLLDPEYGSLVSFWTRLQLLRRMDQVDVVHINLPGLIQLTSPQLVSELSQAEERILSAWAGQLVRAIVKSRTAGVETTAAMQTSATVPGETNTNVLSPSATTMVTTSLLSPTANAKSTESSLPRVDKLLGDQLDVFLSSFRRILSSLPRISQLVVSAHSKCPSGIADLTVSVDHVAEVSWVVHPKHRPQTSMADVTEANRIARRNHVFKPEAEAKEEEAKENTSEPPASGVDAPTSPASSSVADSTHTLADDADLPVQTSWLSERMYRNLTQPQLEKLSVLSSLVALLVNQPGSATANPSQLLTEDRCAAIKAEARTLSDDLLSGIQHLGRRASFDSDSSSASHSNGIRTIRPGEVVKLGVSQPGVHAVVVEWTRSSQPNFEIQLVTAVEGDRLGQADGRSPAADNGAGNGGGSDGGASPTPADSSTSWFSPAPSPTPQAITITSDAAAPQAMRGSDTILPLVHLSRVPVLRTGASPLILPNPVHLIASYPNDTKRPTGSSEDDIEAADDDFSIVVTPYSHKQLETLLAFTEVIVYLRRECRIQPDLASNTSLAAIDDILCQLLQSLIDFLALFQSLCPWPCGRFKGAVFESIGHLFIELSRSIKEAKERNEQPRLASMVKSIHASWCHPFINEARDRHDTEKENWPLFSSYLHRLMELLICAMECEQSAQAAIDGTSSLNGSAYHPVPDSLRAPQPQSRKHSNASSNQDGSIDDVDRYESPSSFIDSSPSRSRSQSVSHSWPSIYHTPPPGHTREHSQTHASGSDLQAMQYTNGAGEHGHEGIQQFATHALPILLDLDRLILHNRSIFLRSVSLSPAGRRCMCSDCMVWRGDTVGLDSALMLVDFNSSIWPLLLGGSMRLLPTPARARLFDELLNATATPERWLPEFSFTTRTERALARDINATSSLDDDDTDSTWEQLVKNLHVTPSSHLRGRLGDVIWKARFKGIANRGAEGLPGPFRQSLTEVCENIRQIDTHTATHRPASLLTHAPNFQYDTGLDRNKLLLRPLANLDEAYAFGQLLGVAIRSQGVLDVDMSALVWRSIQADELSAADLAACDFTAYRFLRFEDELGQQLTRDEFIESHSELTWTTLLSDGTPVELITGGATRPVRFEQRFAYAKRVLQARLYESRLVVNNIRCGLGSIIPLRALDLLSWHELELRACGTPQLDLALLSRHTVYAPKEFGPTSTVVKWFWKALHECTEEERAKFMQFAWARSRLPPESGRESTWRMKLNILDSAGPNDLPTAETCFFNLNLPHYGSTHK